MPSRTPPSQLEHCLFLPESLADVLAKEMETGSRVPYTVAHTRKAMIARRLLRNWTNSLLPDDVPGSQLTEGPVDGFNDGSRSVFHYATLHGDLILTYEYLYLGAIPDKPDANGFTPVFMALVGAAQYEVDVQIPNYVGIPKSDLTKPLAKQLSKVARILIGQHVDPNESHGGYSLIRLALLAKDWETASLLMKHGATLSKDLINSVNDNQVCVTLSELAHRKFVPSKRPTRLCPCWSGQNLKDCHGAPGANIRYPANYLCFCGKDKPYGSCCWKRAHLLESWDYERGRIRCYTDTLPGRSDELRAAVRKIQALDFDAKSDKSYNGNDLPFTGQTQEQRVKFRDMVVRLGMVDPAFAYAMGVIRFPLPCVRANSGKILRAAHAHNWNLCIDKYIAESEDPRSRWEIERAAKVGTWGGAYHRQCFADGCEVVEGQGPVGMKQCSSCQTAVYCSQVCQKADWKLHKTKCDAPMFSPEFLPSQRKILNFMSEKLRQEPGWDDSDHV